MNFVTPGLRAEMSYLLYAPKGPDIALGLIAKFFSANEFHYPNAKGYFFEEELYCEIQDRRKLTLMPRIQFRVGNQRSNPFLSEFYLGLGGGFSTVFGKKLDSGFFNFDCSNESQPPRPLNEYKGAVALQVGWSIEIRKMKN